MENYTDIKDQLTRIETALTGDSFGNKGLVKRLAEVEETQDLHADTLLTMEHKRKMSNVKLSGIIASSVAASHGTWEYIKYLFNK